MDSQIEIALAVRMTCLRLTAESDEGVLVSTTPGAGVGTEEGLVALDGSDIDGVVTAIETSFSQTRRLPKAVCVTGVGHYRIGPGRGAGRLSGKVVLITGSAQGFGKGIAEDMAAAGAAVVVADLNAAAGAQVATELNDQYGAGTACFCSMNVTDLDSIGTALDEVVATFGGLDIFVSNAGVLKAGPLEDMDEASFDLVTNVNYKGYFLCAKAVKPLMVRQHELNPDWVMDIVQVSSKSGLEGSNKNFAYAGSKFGGLGLTQSFAMELVPYRIKVNSVCPGNYFDGPLWSDPERGLFVQYLEAGKVKGAKTIEDVRAFYMAKVPMNRGCTPTDVARAIFYLHEQDYETGQALPVTGGQVMLK